MNRKFFVIIAMLLPQLAFAYSIEGRIIDSEKHPIEGANIVLSKDSANVVSTTTSDVNGKFIFSSINKTGELKISVSMIGMKTSYIQFESKGQNVNLGNIRFEESPNMLNEVEVVAQNVIEKGCNYIVFPTAKELKHSSTSMALLEQLQHKLPGLEVNSSLGRITIENGTAIFLINGRQVSYSRIQSLNNDNILRIEYSNVSDIQYGTSVMGVINFITKPTSNGGSIMATTTASIGNTNVNVGGTFNYGKSEWAVDYGNSWRNYKKIFDTGTECYIGQSTRIVREMLPTPSHLKYMTNNLSIGYTYMHNSATMFAATLEGSTLDRNQEINNLVNQTIDNNTIKYNSYTRNENNSFNPNLDLYFCRVLNKTSKIEMNAYGLMTSGEYNRKLNFDIPFTYSQNSNTDNTSWRAGSEILYTKIYKHFQTKYGVNYYHNYVDNDYSENGGDLQKSEQNNDNLYIHGSISGKVRQMTYSAGIGGRYYRTHNGDIGKSVFKLNSKVTLNYKISSKWSLNYLFMLDPSMPTLSTQSDVIQRIDDISYKVGNPNINPSTYFRNRIYVRYASQKINASLWLAHSRNLDPIYSQYTYISDASSPYYNKFLTQSQNAKYDDLLNAEFQFGYTGIKNFMVSAIVGWDRYTFSGFGNVKPFENFYANINATYAIKNFKLSGRYEIKPRYSLQGNILSTPERWNVIAAQYQWNDFWFTAGIVNPFTKRGGLYRTKELSDVRPVNNNYYIKDCANMITIGLTYRFNWGNKFKKGKQGLKNESIDTGINSEY